MASAGWWSRRHWGCRGCGSQAARAGQSAHAGSAGHWTGLPSPLSPRESATAVWTGNEVPVLGGDSHRAPERRLRGADRSAASHQPRRPASDSWRRWLPAGEPRLRLSTCRRRRHRLPPRRCRPGRHPLPAADPKAGRWAEPAPPPGDMGGLVAVGDQASRIPAATRTGSRPTQSRPGQRHLDALPACRSAQDSTAAWSGSTTIGWCCSTSSWCRTQAPSGQLVRPRCSTSPTGPAAVAGLEVVGSRTLAALRRPAGEPGESFDGGEVGNRAGLPGRRHPTRPRAGGPPCRPQLRHRPSTSMSRRWPVTASW